MRGKFPPDEALRMGRADPGPGQPPGICIVEAVQEGGLKAIKNMDRAIDMFLK